MKLFLITAAAVGALALSAGTASAQHGHHPGYYTAPVYPPPVYGGYYNPGVYAPPAIVIGGGFSHGGFGQGYGGHGGGYGYGGHNYGGGFGHGYGGYGHHRW